MNLKNKKKLAARTFGIGADKIVFAPERISEISEAITKQDIIDLEKDGAIRIKQTRGKRKKAERKTRKSFGKIKKKIRKRKENYMRLTRKLREYLKQLKFQDKVTKEEYRDLRKRIKMKTFRSKSHFKETHKD